MWKVYISIFKTGNIYKSDDIFSVQCTSQKKIIQVTAAAMERTTI